MRVRFFSGLAGFAWAAMAIGAAVAADLAVKAPAAPPLAAAYNWTGCYVGGHIGGAFDNRDSSGFLGGGQVGCDYQFAPGWVLGIEGRGAGTSLKGTFSSSVINLDTGEVRPSRLSVGNDFLASATARIGHTLNDRWLFYLKGGAAWTNERVDDAFTNLAGVAVDPNASTTRTGWTAGTGLEWAFARNWSTSLEYGYYGFGKGVTATDPAANTFVNLPNLKDSIQAVTVGVNYRF